MLSKNQIKKLRGLQRKKERMKSGFYVVEGNTIVDEMIVDSDLWVELYATSKWFENYPKYSNLANTFEITDKDLAMSDAENRESGYVNQLGGIEGVNTTQSTQIGDLFTRTDESNRRLDELGTWNEDRLKEIQGLGGDISGLRGDLSDLEGLVNTPTAVGDVTGLDDIIQNLQTRYTDVAGDVSGLDTRMTQNLDALGSTLRGEFGADIQALNLPAVRDAINAAQGDIGGLTEDFAGLSSDMDWIKKLDLEGFDDRLSEQGSNIRSEFKGDLTDLQNILESGRGEDLANLENQLGKDRAADLLQLRQDVESGRASEIEALAGNLRQEYGDQLFDLSDTFDKRLSGVQSELGGDITDLFGRSDTLQRGVDTLTSDLGTTSQQLGALRDSFGDYQTQAASNLGDVRSALESELGDLSGSLTSGLADVKTDYLDRILGTQQAGATAREGLRSDLTGAISSEAKARRTGLASEASARQSGLATEASAREAGLQSAADARTQLEQRASEGFQDVYKTREQAISDLSGRFGENLRAQEESLGRRIDDTSKAVDEKIGRLGSMMNYRMLGDSAGGVKMRRSKAYKSGAVSTGTGQLSRTMKLKTLNL